MNPYFSRLAQRSGVSEIAGAAKPSNASVPTDLGWGDVSVETAAEPSAQSSDRNAGEAGDGNQAASVRLHDREIPAQASNAIAKSSKPEQAGQITGNDAASLDSDDVSVIASVDSHFSDEDPTIEKTSARSSSADAATLSAPAISAAKSDYSLSHLPRLRSDSDSSLSHTPAKPSTELTIDTQVPGRPLANHPPRFLPADSKFKDAAINEVGAARPHARQAVSSSAVIGNVGKNDLVANPVHGEARAMQQTNRTSRSAVEVNIGKIELEIYAPVKKAATPPAPRQNRPPRSKAAAVFNPHRHYLRGH